VSHGNPWIRAGWVFVRVSHARKVGLTGVGVAEVCAIGERLGGTGPGRMSGDEKHSSKERALSSEPERT